MATALSANAAEFVPSQAIVKQLKTKKTKEQRGPRKRKRLKKTAGTDHSALETGIEVDDGSFDDLDFTPYLASPTPSETSSISKDSLAAELHPSHSSCLFAKCKQRSNSHVSGNSSIACPTGDGSQSSGRRRGNKNQHRYYPSEKKGNNNNISSNESDWSLWFDRIVERLGDGTPDSSDRYSPMPMPAPMPIPGLPMPPTSTSLPQRDQNDVTYSAVLGPDIVGDAYFQMTVARDVKGTERKLRNSKLALRDCRQYYQYLYDVMFTGQPALMCHAHLVALAQNTFS
jgi:hypothetical protein